MGVIFYIVGAFIFLGIIIAIGTKQMNDGNIQHKDIQATYIEGINNLIGEYKCTLSTLDNHLLIVVKKNNLKIELPYEKIISIGTKIERHQEITSTTKNKSPVARGLVGSALMGGAGLVLGGMSGLNSKTETNTSTVAEDYICITYKTDSEENTIILKTYCPRFN